MTAHHEPSEKYTGAAVISADGVDVPVEVQLRGAFQPIDGRFHWYGRVAATDALELAPGGAVTLRTAHGTAEARLSDVDTWGRLRVTGLGQPPF